MKEFMLWNVDTNEKSLEEKPLTCFHCKHRQRWECNSKIIQYCGITHSNRTENGLKKIKASSIACDNYKCIK